MEKLNIPGESLSYADLSSSRKIPMLKKNNLTWVTWFWATQTLTKTKNCVAQGPPVLISTIITGTASKCDSFFGFIATPSTHQVHCSEWNSLICLCLKSIFKSKPIPYPLECSPGVLFFKMDFWVGFNSKYLSKSGLFSKKVGFYSRKTPKTWLFKLHGALFKSGVAFKRIR